MGFFPAGGVGLMRRDSTGVLGLCFDGLMGFEWQWDDGAVLPRLVLASCPRLLVYGCC